MLCVDVSVGTGVGVGVGIGVGVGVSANVGVMALCFMSPSESSPYHKMTTKRPESKKEIPSQSNTRKRHR